VRIKIKMQQSRRRHDFESVVNLRRGCPGPLVTP